MITVNSADGTPIAYDRFGDGRPIIFVVGAMNDHTRCAPLAQALSVDFTVLTYDRRGRGESGDTPPYAIEHEVEDLTALIAEVGGEATVFGYSSGGVLALKAAADGAPITRMAVFEAPFALGGMPAAAADLPDRLADLVRDGRPGDAVALFQSDVIGLPPELTAQMRQSPMWPAMEAMALSVVYDTTITTRLAVPTAEMAAVSVPTLVLAGADTWPDLKASAQALAALLPAARYVDVAGGANHDIPTDATAEVLRAFH